MVRLKQKKSSKYNNRCGRRSSNNRKNNKEYNYHHQTQKKRSSAEQIRRIYQIVFSNNVAFPITIGLILLVEVLQETVFSTCTILTHTYFLWNDNAVGFFLAFLGGIALLTNVAVAMCYERLEERRIIKRCLTVLPVGMILLLNFSSFGSLFLGPVNNDGDKNQTNIYTYYTNYSTRNNSSSSISSKSHLSHTNSYYLFGIYQFLFAMTIIISAVCALSCANILLLSKKVPEKLKKSNNFYCISSYRSYNCPMVSLSSVNKYVLLIAIMTHIGKMVGDTLTTLVGLSLCQLLNKDLINVLFLPLIGLCFVFHTFVKQYYYFLV